MSSSRAQSSEPHSITGHYQEEGPDGTRRSAQIQHTGPLPHPSVLAEYQRIIPEAPERILNLLELESAHRQSLEDRRLDLEQLRIEGQLERQRRWLALEEERHRDLQQTERLMVWLSVGLLLLLIGIGVWLTVQFHNPWLLIIPLGGLGGIAGLRHLANALRALKGGAAESPKQAPPPGPNTPPDQTP